MRDHPRLTSIGPMFLVDDVVATAEWYRDTLGFTIGEYYRDDHSHDPDGNDIAGSSGEAVHVIIERDGQRILFGKTVRRGQGVRTNFDDKQHSSDAYVWCEGVDRLFAEAEAAGATFLLQPETQPYGLREFKICDRDGRVLTFGGLPD